MSAARLPRSNGGGGVRPRLVDWLLLAFVLAETATGLLSFLEGRPEGRLLFALHGALGLGILLLLAWKLRRVHPRLAERRFWDRATAISVAALLLVLLTVGSGVVWATWRWPAGSRRRPPAHCAARKWRPRPRRRRCRRRPAGGQSAPSDCATRRRGRRLQLVGRTLPPAQGVTQQEHAAVLTPCPHGRKRRSRPRPTTGQ